MPGVHHQDNFSGAVDGVTLRIGAMNWTVRNSDVDQMDVETAFWKVHSKRVKESTQNAHQDVCMEIWKGMCGVQSAGVHWSKNDWSFNLT